MTALANLDDLAVVLGSEPTDASRAARMIELASANVEDWCGRRFARVEGDQVVVLVDRSGALRLPNGPVESVAEVVDPGGADVTVDDLTISGDMLHRAVGLWSPGTYQVTYTHGFDPIPDVVVDVVCSLAALRLSAGTPGYSSESLGDWSGAVRLDPASRAAAEDVLGRLDRYRRRVGRVEVV